jgi:hypothetical protein
MKRRIFGVAALLALLSTAVLTVPANAAGAGLKSYRAKASASALSVTLADQQLSLAAASSVVDSTLNATGAGAGDLVTLASHATAKQTKVNGTKSDGKNCSPLTLPPEVPVIDAAIGCGTATASILNGVLDSTGKGEIAGVGVGVTDLNPILDPVLGTILDLDALHTLCSALAVVCDGVDGLGIDLESTLNELITALTVGGNALDVSVGPSTTHTFANKATVTSESLAATTIIKVLSRDLLTDAITHQKLDPVLTITVLPASAKVVRSRVDGSVLEQGGTPAALVIDIASDIATLTGLPKHTEIGDSAQLAALQSSGVFDENGCLNPGGVLPAPLNALLCIKLATIEKYSDAKSNMVGVEATTLELRLLDSLVSALGIGSGLDLQFGNAVAEVAAVPAVAPPVTPNVPDTPRDLPRTGGPDMPLGLTVALIGVAFMGMAAVRRSLAAAR